MVAPMGLFMLIGMWGMFKNTRLNMILSAAFVALFIAAFALARVRGFLDNEQFLRNGTGQGPTGTRRFDLTDDE